MLEKLFSFVKNIELFKSASGDESNNAIEAVQTAEPKEENICSSRTLKSYSQMRQMHMD